MIIEWKPRAPSAHCYHCGSMDIAAVCHHCGRPMCAEHSVVSDVGRRSTEFSDLHLDSVAARHCHDHDHTIDGGVRWMYVAGGADAAVGAICLPSLLWLGVAMVAIGVGVVATGVWLGRRRRNRAVHARPPIPLVPVIESVGITETVHTDIRLDADGQYTATPSPATGQLKVEMQLGKGDRRRLAGYREKYRLTENEPVAFSSGFLLLRGAVGLEFDDRRIPVPVIALQGMVADFPFLTSAGGRNRRYPIELAYHLRAGSEVRSVPLWLTPSLVAESDRRTLELDLQWEDFGQPDEPLEIDHITEFRLVVPVAWGNVRKIYLDRGVQTSHQSYGRAPDPDDPDEFVRVIRVTGIRLPRAATKARRLRLFVDFEDRIETSDTIRGSIDVLFQHAVSGVSAVEVHHPLGGPRSRADDVTAAMTTRVIANFSLSLAKVCYQDSHVVPDPRRTGENGKPGTTELVGVIPNHETVARLTDALSASEYYVKRVVENPGSTGPGTGMISRYWDIAGRYYESVFPVEFRIVLTGEEEHDGHHEATRGTTHVTITVRGVYANPDMRKLIESVWEQLYEQTLSVLETPRGYSNSSTDQEEW